MQEIINEEANENTAKILGTITFDEERKKRWMERYQEQEIPAIGDFRNAVTGCLCAYGALLDTYIEDNTLPIKWVGESIVVDGQPISGFEFLAGVPFFNALKEGDEREDGSKLFDEIWKENDDAVASAISYTYGDVIKDDELLQRAKDKVLSLINEIKVD